MTTEAPPTYEATSEVSTNAHLPTSELLHLEIRGNSVVHCDTNTVLYELSQAPALGQGTVLGIEQVIYKPTPPGSDEPGIRRRLRHMYDVKPPTWVNPALRPEGVYLIYPECGSNICVKGGAALIRGKRYGSFRFGSSWNVVISEGKYKPRTSVFQPRVQRGDATIHIIEWRDEHGAIVATETIPKGEQRKKEQQEPLPPANPALNLKVHLEDKMLHLLVTAWCGLLWLEEREANLQQMQKKMDKSEFRTGIKEFLTSLRKGELHGRKQPYGAFVPSQAL